MITTVLSQAPLFASLPRDEVERLAASLRRLDLAAGDVLLREGEPGNHFYLIISGELEIIKTTATSEEHLIGVGRAGEFIGEMCLLNPDGLRSADVRARSQSQVVEMQRADLDALLRHHPQVAYDLARALSLRLKQTDDNMIGELREKNAQLSSAFESLQKAQRQIIEQEKLQRELEVARKIQGSMLPTVLPEMKGFDFGAHMEPAQAVGGDFYDFFPLGEDSMGIAIGDVSGKGVPAALFMALTRSLLRAEASRTVAPVETLRHVNRHLLQMGNGRMFVTVLYGVLRRVTRDFVYVRAGHEPPLTVDANGETKLAAPAAGQPLGLLPDPELNESILTLAPGSTLLLYTDGATEAMDEEQELFGMERLETEFGAMREVAAQESCSRLLQSLTKYRGGAAQADDITLVAAHVQ